VKLAVGYYKIYRTSCLLFSFYSRTATQLRALEMRHRSERILSPPQRLVHFDETWYCSECWGL